MLLLLSSPTRAQTEQLYDPTADVSVAKPAFAKNAGPSVLIDQAHHNFHTADARLKPFADLLRNDGFKVEASQQPFTAAVLARAKIMVIVNALNQVNVDHAQLPTPSAFTPAEIAAVKTWVSQGGALLLIADHMPFAGAANDLASAFKINFINGFAFHLPPLPGDAFTRDTDTLGRDRITQGLNRVVTFTGSAFDGAPGLTPLLIFPKGYQVLMPKIAWQFSPSTPTVDAAGKLQGATLGQDKGRLAVFGNAALFTAVDNGGIKFGFNSPDAPDDKPFVLNVMRWLAGALK